MVQLLKPAEQPAAVAMALALSNFDGELVIAVNSARTTVRALFRVLNTTIFHISVETISVQGLQAESAATQYSFEVLKYSDFWYH